MLLLLPNLQNRIRHDDVDVGLLEHPSRVGHINVGYLALHELKVVIRLVV